MAGSTLARGIAKPNNINLTFPVLWQKQPNPTIVSLQNLTAEYY